jgi:NAD(P)-dependent dehydrogenase (short-subunit alcohol dehydrogenase family)
VKYAGREMTRQGSGSIILTSSAASLRANAGAISYSAAKAAVNSLAQCAANAFSGTGVRVNAILPGLVETQMTRKVFEQARERGVEARIGHMTPLKRAGRPEEIAAMAAFLASDDSSFVDGQCYAVDGGVSSTHPHGRIAL